MQLFVTVKPRAKEKRVEYIDATHLIVHVPEPPEDNKANLAVIEAIAKAFHVPKLCVKITSGQKSKRKTVTLVL
ncbi:MAG: DUF167 domain-containing protein [Candidatus Dojkabacteria bacterium]|nr:MAG: DUF167 domain-containing protein [Candidatus Dojkabacteria bacterium]